jgi:hypothetical protein
VEDALFFFTKVWAPVVIEIGATFQISSAKI